MGGNDNYPGEVWIEIEFSGFPAHPIYEISNFGRVKSYAYSEKGRLIKGTISSGYRVFKTKLVDTEGNLKDQSFLIHRLVAQYFLPKNNHLDTFVIHKDHDKQNNHVSNLTWASQDAVNKHNASNPNVIRNNLDNRNKGNYKLNEAKVRVIKRQIKNNKTRPKLIAKQFGISLTQLNRIIKGENWGQVNAD
jgi:transcriptional regulator with AAA-type ATPase domain